MPHFRTLNTGDYNCTTTLITVHEEVSSTILSHVLALSSRSWQLSPQSWQLSPQSWQLSPTSGQLSPPSWTETFPCNGFHTATPVHMCACELDRDKTEDPLSPALLSSQLDTRSSLNCKIDKSNTLIIIKQLYN